MALQIDVVSDIVCPWCFIGKRQLEGAMRSLAGPSEVQWHPMQLYPEIPEQGADKDRFLTRRYGNLDGVNRAIELLGKAGLELGISFDFDLISRIPNSLDAHRMIYACPPPQQDQLVDNLFSAFFEQGSDISDREVLLSVAEKSAFALRDAAQALEDETTRTAVLAEQARLRKLGLEGIPNILLNKSLAVTGAKDSESLVRAFDYALFGIPEKDEAPPVIH